MDDSTIDGISKRQYRIFMNSIHQDLKFATETEKGKLPTFASKTWSEAESVRHSFFEKEMMLQVIRVFGDRI